MTLWHWIEGQGIPGFVLGSWGAAIPIGGWIHRVTGRRHRQRLAATHQLTAALQRTTEQEN